MMKENSKTQSTRASLYAAGNAYDIYICHPHDRYISYPYDS